MKKFKSLYLSSLVFLSFITTFNSINAQIDVDIEKVKEICKGTPYEERVRVSVARFNTTTVNARGEFGGELATMLTNALQQVNCFRVLESASNMSDMTQEIELSQGGYTADGSSPQAGKMLGAQAILTGEVTEFSEGENSAGAFGVKLSKNKARVGFIIKVINPQTREVIFSRSVESEGRAPGSFSGVKLLGVDIAGGTKSNTAIGDAVERGIIKAVQILAEEKDNIPFPEANSGVKEAKVWNALNCAALSAGNTPSVMIMIPEKYRNATRYIDDSAGETAIINKFVRSGFKVIDPSMYAAIRKGARFEEAINNPVAAASLGSEFGADIVVIGDGISEMNNRQNNNMYSCRSVVKARAIQVSNGQILMANEFNAGATDVSQSGASKSALRRAGEMIADDFLEQICTSSIALSGEKSAGLQTTVLKISNTDFAKMKRISDLLEKDATIKSVDRTSFSGGSAVLEIKHEGTSDDIVDIVAGKAASLCDITGFQSNEIEVTMK